MTYSPSCSSSERATHKAGTTFGYAGQIEREVYDPATDSTTAETDFTGWQGASEIRTEAGALVDTLTFEWLDEATGLARIFSQDTSGWPEGVVLIDVKLTAPDGVTVATETQQIYVTSGVTE